MTTRILGLDSWSPANEVMIKRFALEAGQAAAFWGRYVNSVKSNKAPEYNDAAEGRILAKYNCRVLLVARQTSHVGLDFDTGKSEGEANGYDVVNEFGEEYLAATCPTPRIFLDVEGNGPSRLSSDYYRGWCDGLRASSSIVSFRPCVYGLPGDRTTWDAVRSALLAGAQCFGTWLSHPWIRGASPEPVQWSESMLRPYTPIDGVPILLHQYLFPKTSPPDPYALQFDQNIVNPDIDAEEFLSTLPIPRAA